jgi:hypothetical protein
MDNFNLKKFLTENKLTKTSVLREGFEETNSEPYDETYTDRNEWIETIKAKYPNAEPNAKFGDDNIWFDNGDRVAQWISSEDAGKIYFNVKPLATSPLIYPKGSRMDEAAKEKLKAKIKEMIIAELDGSAVTDEDYDFVAEGSDDEDYEKAGREVEFGVNPDKEEFDLKDFFMDDEEALDEAKKDEEAPAEEELSDEEIDATIDTTDTGEDFNVDTSAVDPNIKAVQDALTQAQAAAKSINDDKLTQQIGNTITMFTRTHIANTEAPTAE